MTTFRAKRRGADTRARFAIGVVAVALLAGCTSVTGDPVAGDDLGAGTVAGTASSASSPASDVPAAGDGGDISGTEGREPTSVDLIAAALDAGEIDEATSLLYRTWLYFGDPQLPEQYIGAEQPYELGLLAEVRGALDSMPTDIRAQVEPYLLRPEDPASAFNAAAGESDPPGLRGPTSGALKAGETKEPPHKCQTGWDSMPVTGLNFRVWTCRDADALREGSNADAMATMAAMLQKYVPDMTADMGELIPDDPNKQPGEHADARIDVYVMPTNWLAPARGLEWLYSKLGEITGGVDPDVVPNYARTVSSPPEAGVTSSSFVLVSSDHFGDMALLERMVVHELFHAFQYSHNRHVDAAWWTEGSAEWAASYYVRSDSGRLHGARLPVVQDSTFLSLIAETGLRPYGAYIWSLFMEQEAGPDAIFATWDALAGAPRDIGDEEVIAAIDAQVPMAENFPEFVMRLLNAKGAAGEAIAPRFVNVDGHFPNARMPDMAEYTVAKEPVEVDVFEVQGLGYRYYRVTVETPPDHPEGTAVMVRVTGSAPTGSGLAPVLEALVRGTDGDYSRQRIAYTGDGDEVCVDEDMLLALSNTSTNQRDNASGTLTLTRLDDVPCTRIEASDPVTLQRLDSGDRVDVDGQEGDGEPDVAPLVISVFDVPAEDVADYSVTVTLTGGTLSGPRDFEWPLAEFEEVSPGLYRMTETVPLDIDLTDANRDFTIDARLLHDTADHGTVQVGEHDPTVKLHGQEACGTRVTYVSNSDPDPLTMSWNCAGQSALLLVDAQMIMGESGTTLCSYDDGECQPIPFDMQNFIPSLGFFIQVDQAREALAAGEDAGDRIIAGVDATCRVTDEAGPDGNGTWCVGKENPDVLLFWENNATGESLTATEVGKPRPGDFVPFGAR